jgi:hypothetical protein
MHHGRRDATGERERERERESRDEGRVKGGSQYTL